MSNARFDFDDEGFKREIEKVYRSLRISHDVQDAIDALANIAPAPLRQAIELSNLLSCAVQEGKIEVRKVGFEFLVRLASSACWREQSMGQALKIFMEEVFPDLNVDVPNLQNILRHELHVALKPLVCRGILKDSQLAILSI